MFDVENPALAELLGTMVDMVVAAGGSLAPQLTFVERAGSISIHRPIDAPPVAWLATVPAAVLVPVGELDWAERNDRFALASEPAGLTPERRQMLDLFMAIYNAAAKPDWLAGSFNVVAQRDPSLLAAVSRVKPGARPLEGPLARQFIATRTLTMGKSAGDLADVPLIMPVLDFLNHHPSGKTFRFHEGQMVIAETHVAQSNECFASYGGRRDAFDLLIGHHFVDETPYAATTAVQLKLPELGRLLIEARFIRSNHKADPPKVSFDEEGVVLSHLVFDSRNPRPTLQLLEMAVLALARRRAVPDDRARKAMADVPPALLDANRAALAALRADLDARTDNLPLAAMVRRAADIQEANLVASLTPNRPDAPIGCLPAGDPTPFPLISGRFQMHPLRFRADRSAAGMAGAGCWSPRNAPPRPLGCPWARFPRSGAIRWEREALGRAERRPQPLKTLQQRFYAPAALRTGRSIATTCAPLYSVPPCSRPCRAGPSQNPSGFSRPLLRINSERRTRADDHRHHIGGVDEAALALSCQFLALSCQCESGAPER